LFAEIKFGWTAFELKIFHDIHNNKSVTLNIQRQHVQNLLKTNENIGCYSADIIYLHKCQPVTFYLVISPLYNRKQQTFVYISIYLFL